MNNNRRRSFRPRPQKNNFRRRNGGHLNNNSGNFNNGNLNFNRNGFHIIISDVDNIHYFMYLYNFYF